MLWGLAKKMVLADNLGAIVDAAYRTPASMGGAELALATVCFAFQIYCDFSAYSDLAVGAAKLFNLPLKRNFAYPYFSQSLSEFWRRWHISLSTWLRDYVYIPLGGNRGSRGLTARNLLLTALTSGLWHGAAWHFVVWGWLHGIYLVAGRIVHPVPKVRTFPAVPGGEQNLPGPGTVLRMVLVFSLVCLAWVPFRAASLADAAQVYGKIVSQIATAGFYVAWSSLVRQHLVVLLFLGAFVVIEWLSRRNWNTFAVARAPLLVRWCAYSGLFWVILCFGTRRTEDFIYFRF
jgi:D-alanyl-lipoteichoic acid acyltransferase DltB (MBOAT superfamily)